VTGGEQRKLIENSFWTSGPLTGGVRRGRTSIITDRFCLWAGAGAVVPSRRAESERLLGGHRRSAGVKVVFGPDSSASSVRQPVTIWALAHIPGESLSIFQPASDFSPSCRTQSFLPLRVGCCGPCGRFVQIRVFCTRPVYSCI
jgi:hypothetical protein